MCIASSATCSWLPTSEWVGVELGGVGGWASERDRVCVWGGGGQEGVHPPTCLVRLPPTPHSHHRRVLASADVALLLQYESPCPCGSGGKSYKCCGWHAREEEVRGAGGGGGRGVCGRCEAVCVGGGGEGECERAGARREPAAAPLHPPTTTCM